GDFFSWAGLTTGYLQGEIFSVHNIPSPTPSTPPAELWDFKNSSGSSHPYSDNDFYDDFGQQAMAMAIMQISNLFTSTIDVSKQYIYNTNIDNIASANYIQGVLRATGLGIGTGSFTKNIIRIGTGDYIYSGSDLTGNFGEIILYNRKLSTIERRKVWTYLAVKYGITLESTGGGSNGDYIATNNTTIWDASINSNYHNNIIGIGRDDNEALLQKQSHTMHDTTRLYIDALQTANASNQGTFASDISYVLIGDNKGLMDTSALSNMEVPPGLSSSISRVEREWKVTKSNFSQNFSCDFILSPSASFDTNCVQLLVDDDGDFTNATIYNQSSTLSFSYFAGVITVNGISNIHIPDNSTRYITIATATINPIIDLGNDTSLCQGETLTLDATTSNATYIWQDGSTNPTFNVTTQGQYYVNWTIGGCIHSDTINVYYETTFPTGSAPANIIVECIGDIPTADPLLIIDEADNNGTPTVTFNGDVSDGLTCPETITRTYSITDDCGNVTTVDQLIILYDVTPPTATNPVPQAGLPPVFDPTQVTDEADNCGVPTVTDGGDVSDGGNCPEIITRTYIITDACGNAITIEQTFTIGDPIMPTASNPLPMNVECIGDVLAPDVTVVTDENDNEGPPVVTWEDDTSDGNTCPEVILRRYRATDNCENFIFVTQTITVLDVINPTATAPATVNVECIGDVPAANILDITTEADNCTASPVVVHVGDVSDGLTCPETITRTYSITDDCGNQITVDQLIIVNDMTPPTATNVPPTPVPGSMDVPAPDITVVTTEADNCTVNPVVAWVSDVADGNVCNGEIITRTYSVTDDCGNQIFVTHEITILAVPAPIDAGLDWVICQGELVTIVADNPWNVPIAWNPVVPVGQFDPLVTTTYTVTADNLGCISTDAVTVTVTPLPSVSFTADNLSGCAPHTVTFTNTTPGITSDCIWSIGGVPFTGCSITTTLDAGLYDVTLGTTNDLGCSSIITYTDYIYVEDLPIASFSLSTTELLNTNTEVNFMNTSTGATNYVWDFGDNTATSTVDSPTHIYPDGHSGSYLVELIAYTPLGCTDTATIIINVSEELIYYVPNSFSPDGDGFNQYFQPVFYSGYDPFDFTMYIFNRWGQVIFETHNVDVGWDGTFGGKLMQDGTYTWKMEFKTSETDERMMVSGHVNLLK
ncbi:MAG: gliding motility-associated C-terminal domain-containing protein, partial [Crocinitomicaceae bacterium]|nr:gliding motility-associated C-terminal domain-containing protein [Crocinitomicaceae bacterium]